MKIRSIKIYHPNEKPRNKDYIEVQVRNKRERLYIELSADLRQVLLAYYSEKYNQRKGIITLNSSPDAGTEYRSYSSVHIGDKPPSFTPSPTIPMLVISSGIVDGKEFREEKIIEVANPFLTKQPTLIERLKLWLK